LLEERLLQAEENSIERGKTMAKKKTTAKAEEVADDESDGVTAKVKDEGIGRDARHWAMFCHLAGLAWMVAWLLPFIGGVVGTLIVWQVKKDDDPFIDENGRRAFNFQLSMLIYSLGLAITVIGIFLLPIVAILDIGFTIVAAIRASNGKDHHYPLSIEFIK
jgi:uncharacterized Tic20 family protein